MLITLIGLARIYTYPARLYTYRFTRFSDFHVNQITKKYIVIPGSPNDR